MPRVFAKAIEISRKEFVADRTFLAVVGVMTFAFATALGGFARFYLPGNPIPITLQTFFVLLAGAVLGTRKGALSQTLFLLGGAFGLPIFAAGNFGFAYILGPTGGYLAGFVAAAASIGFLIKVKPKASFAWVLGSMLFGLFLIYAFGVIRLSVFVGGLDKAFVLGVLPFIPGAFLKVLAASLIYRSISQRAREIF